MYSSQTILNVSKDNTTLHKFGQRFAQRRTPFEEQNFSSRVCFIKIFLSGISLNVLALSDLLRYFDPEVLQSILEDL